MFLHCKWGGTRLLDPQLCAWSFSALVCFAGCTKHYEEATHQSEIVIFSAQVFELFCCA